jgi:hypothetical protein
MTTSQPQRRERVLLERVDDETVLLDLESGLYFSLNDVGARIWELCDGSRTVDDIVTVICDEYDAPRDVIAADVHELLDGLAGQQLLVI